MILCCGEALIDMIPGPSRTGPDGFVPHPGGAVFNTAIALGRLGVPTGLLSGLSTDMFGDQLKAELARSSVSADHVIWSDRPTTLAFVQLHDGQARYAFFDENSAGRMIAQTDLPPLAPQVQALFFGGISLVSEPGADAYLHLATREAPRQLIMLDPNIRSSFIADEARYRARLDRMLHCADIVKLSDEDLAWLCDTGDLHETARAFQKEHDCLLILTQGDQGASAFLPSGEMLQIPAVKVPVADTVGAGDTFNAGVLTSFAEQGCLSKMCVPGLTPEQVETALTFASQVAAATVTRRGANPPFRSELVSGGR